MNPIRETVYILLHADGTRFTGDTFTLEGANREIDLWFEAHANVNDPEVDLMAFDYPRLARISEDGRMEIMKTKARQR